ncbi:MAG TPA: DUF5666 domain-containing protein [Silvibacterium sp.]|nr:DUF5666 domain-containing protein [Silvibacterium sp.]
MKPSRRIAYQIPILLVGAALLLQHHPRLLLQAQVTFDPGSEASGSGMDQIEAHSIRGDITAISGDRITMKTDEGETYSVSTGPNTRFRKQRDLIKLSDLHVGDMIAAVGDKDTKAKTLGAMFVMFIDREQYQKMRADFGKTWTAGVVQSVDGTNIIVKRPDNVVQTIAVDENTSFRRHREDITLPDVRAGDNISAHGALQNGSFLATVVNVGGPRGIGSGSGHPGPASDTH